jgi:hypothetical protein
MRKKEKVSPIRSIADKKEDEKRKSVANKVHCRQKGRGKKKKCRQ